MYWCNALFHRFRLLWSLQTLPILVFGLIGLILIWMRPHSPISLPPGSFGRTALFTLAEFIRMVGEPLASLPFVAPWRDPVERMHLAIANGAILATTLLFALAVVLIGAGMALRRAWGASSRVPDGVRPPLSFNGDTAMALSRPHAYEVRADPPAPGELESLLSDVDGAGTVLQWRRHAARCGLHLCFVLVVSMCLGWIFLLPAIGALLGLSVTGRRLGWWPGLFDVRAYGEGLVIEGRSVHRVPVGLFEIRIDRGIGYGLRRWPLTPEAFGMVFGLERLRKAWESPAWWERRDTMLLAHLTWHDDARGRWRRRGPFMLSVAQVRDLRDLWGKEGPEPEAERPEPAAITPEPSPPAPPEEGLAATSR